MPVPPLWPATDVLRELEIAADGSVATARTELYLQGIRDHLYTSTMIIAADLLASSLLDDAEDIVRQEEVQFRNLSNHNLVLTAAFSQSHTPNCRAPAIRGRYRSSRNRIVWIEGTLSDERIGRRDESPGIVVELLARMRLEQGPADAHRTRLAPLADIYRGCARPLLIRYAILEFVLEATRQLIRERFGDLDGSRLVVAGLRDLVFPPWTEIARGCVLEYRLSEDQLSSGTRLVHCDLSFSPRSDVGRLTIARVPGSRMQALETQPAAPEGSAGAGADGSRVAGR
jgi:hypothetical protein